MWSDQKQNTRLVFVKRAQVYHSGRVYMHALYRRRSALDDQLLDNLVELCLSPYTRVRRYVRNIHAINSVLIAHYSYAQSVFHNVCGVRWQVLRH
jgi:proteasome activator subunit 4